MKTNTTHKIIGYRIKIQRIELSTVEHREWKIVADTGNPKDAGCVYDYTPPINITQETEMEIFDQRVKTLNMEKLIKAINEIH